ncbi:MAG: peptidase S41 [Anaerolineae bacterium]|nr:peptidase S41 [Anaerolineae bacterium]
MKYKYRLIVLAMVGVISLACSLPSPIGGSTPQGQAVAELGQFPPANIKSDEGGPVLITGELNYTYPFFTAGVAQPIVILEDQAGFVDRDRKFVIPAESQTLGQITSDFYLSPFTYSITLPIEPAGSLRDVDQDEEKDTGVMVFAVAYWTNTWGDPFLERRDQGGGGWSTAYASTRVSDNRGSYREIYGGKLVVYAPDANQGFPSAFGDDGMLFTDDDLLVQLPQGWTVVDLDTDPFTFDRSREPEIDLIEPESIALDDFSRLSYAEAFDAMLEKFRNEYAFTEYKNIDWNAKSAEFRPRFEEAESARDNQAYALALRDFVWSIPDTHVGMDFSLLYSMYATETAGGLGMAIRELDDGRVIVVYVLEDGPADRAGIAFGAEITEYNGTPIGEAISTVVPWASPFSNDESKRLQQLRYLLRSPVGTEVPIVYQNPGDSPQSARLTSVPENLSFNASSLSANVTGIELPVEYTILDSGYGYAGIYSFFDNEVLTIQLWERMIRTMNESGVPGLILDLRQNGGGSGWLANQMAAYFFDEELELGKTGRYDDSTGQFEFDPSDNAHFIPPRGDLRYHGDVVVLVGPACASACEFFAYNMTIEDRARIVGQYTTAGAGGSVEDFLMPESISIRMTIGRAVDVDGNIHIEGTGVAPTIRVPVTEANILAEYRDGADAILEAAIEALGG